MIKPADWLIKLRHYHVPRVGEDLPGRGSAPCTPNRGFPKWACGIYCISATRILALEEQTEGLPKEILD